MSIERNEATTRKELIDHQLNAAGWGSSNCNLLEEYTLTKDVYKNATDTSHQSKEYVDYLLLNTNKQPIAIVEAKRSSKDPIVGKRQASDYADLIYAKSGIEPFIFLTNGKEIWFWERQQYPLRKISNFLNCNDLEKLAFQRQYRVLLGKMAVNPQIAGRPYQIEGIKRITEALDKGQRKFLLVMATGTGKTRTVIALVDLLMRAKWVQKVLFLADRRELVRQALGELKEHLPNEGRSRIEGNEIEHASRIHVATYPSMLQAYQQLSPGYYDLIIADESHRSIYNRYKVLFDHFDALQLGLTATPTDYIDHNTFDLFECPDGLPTFYYPYETAVQEDYLVNYRVLEARTSFQIKGIKAGQLPPELQKQLIEQNIDINEINFEGSDLEKRVTNSGTNDAIVQEFMLNCRKDAIGTLPAKTIIFAMSHRHALEIWKSFNRLYPDKQRLGLAEIIDSHMERVDKTLDDFKYKDMPCVAISVDMLDTGIDIPSIQNLVFAKPVFSQVKFWQMIGRGTRLWKDPATSKTKTDFLIIDYWNNFSYFNMNPEGEIASSTEPLPVKLFRLRLEKLLLLRGQGKTEAIANTISQLQTMLSLLPKDNINVQPHLAEITSLEQSSNWESIDTTKAEHLEKSIAPLMRFSSSVSLSVMTFEILIERLAIAYLLAQFGQIDKLKEKILDDLKQLPINLQEVKVEADKLAWVASSGFWEHLEYQRIMDLQTRFAPLMRYRQYKTREIISLNLPDKIESRYWIIYGPGGEGAYADSYREQVEAYLKTISDQLPGLTKLQQGQPLDQSDLQALTDVLNRPDLFITEEVLRTVYSQPEANLSDFLNHIFGLKHLASREEQIKTAFDQFIAAHPYFTATQINFVRTIRSAILRGTKLSNTDLQNPPFSRVGRVTTLFSDNELSEVLNFANNLVA